MTTSKFAESIATVEIVGARPLPEELPRFHWYHGTRQGRTAGHFFVKASAVGAEPGAPWEPFTNAYDEPGYKAEQLKIAVVAMREQWFIPGETPGATATYISGYQPGAKSNIEILCFVEGFDDLMVLSASGKFKAGALKQALRQYSTGLLRQAQTIAGKALHPWTFWIPLGGARDSKGNPVYEETQGANGSKGAMVTPPMLLTPLDMDALYVGPDMLKRGEAESQARSDWAQQRRLPQNTVEGEVVTPRQLPAGAVSRNVPQPIEDDASLPF
jgi:hypothetical protein